MFKKNKRGQAGFGILLFIGSLLIFVFIWAVWLGAWLQDYATTTIQAGTVTGIEAFVIANLNLIIFLGLILTIFLAIYFGASQG
jgi:hypothetical protein